MTFSKAVQFYPVATLFATLRNHIWAASCSFAVKSCAPHRSCVLFNDLRATDYCPLSRIPLPPRSLHYAGLSFICTPQLSFLCDSLRSTARCPLSRTSLAHPSLPFHTTKASLSKPCPFLSCCNVVEEANYPRAPNLEQIK